MSTIVCEKLCKSFVQGDQVIKGLDQLDLQIGEAEFVCLSGPSGSGKTTLLNALGGLDSLDSGKISIGARRVDTMSASERAYLRLTQIGFVFQSYNLIPVLSALENVEFVMQLQGLPLKQRRQRALQLLKEVGLEHMESRRPAELSGGQQQRVAVARAIVSQPELVLADEPTANLDSRSAGQLLDLFLELNKRHGITFVIATHDQRVVARCRRLISMQDGRIVSDDVLFA